MNRYLDTRTQPARVIARPAWFSGEDGPEAPVSDAYLISVGILPIVDAPIPPGHVAVATGYEGRDEDGRALEAHQLAPEPLPARKARLLEAVNTRRDGLITGGYSHEFGEVGRHVLQTRGADDKLNWLTSQAAYEAAVRAGLGNNPGARFRSAANVTFVVTYQEGLAALLAMAAWGAAIFDRSWTLKDSIEAALDDAALDAVDINSGWPG